MISGEIKSQIDRIWDAFLSGGISNPLEVIEQITYLLFLKRLNELHTLEKNRANRIKKSASTVGYLAHFMMPLTCGDVFR